jgi:hypothetical protein
MESFIFRSPDGHERNEKSVPSHRADNDTDSDVDIPEMRVPKKARPRSSLLREQKPVCRHAHEDAKSFRVADKSMQQSRKSSPVPGTSRSNICGSNPTDYYLVTGVGHRDYSLLREASIGGSERETGDDIHVDPHIRDFQVESTPSTIVSDKTVREMTMWLPPEKLLAAVETKLAEAGPRLAESGTLGAPSMLASQWSTPTRPFAVGALTEPVPRHSAKWYGHKMICSRHKGYNDGIPSPPLPYNCNYQISTPRIHANSLSAAVISCELRGASCCYPVGNCHVAHHMDDIVVNTKAAYSQFMDVIKKTSPWLYITKFVNTESFIYTTQVFVRGVYYWQAHALSRPLHTETTLIFPKVPVPSDGIILSTAMRECFTIPSRRLVGIKKISLVIECHGSRPGRYFAYKLERFFKRTAIVCVCADRSGLPCCCAHQYIDTLVKLSNDKDGARPSMAPSHPLAALHVQSLPKTKSIIAYNVFLLIDELLTRSSADRVKFESTMRGNNVIMQMGNFTNKAAFISHQTKYSFAHQPVLFSEIHLSRVVLKTAQHIVNTVAHMCVNVVFALRYGNPDRSALYDQKYNDLVKQLKDVFPVLDIVTLPYHQPRSPNPTRYGPVCDNCGGIMEFVKKGDTSILVCCTCKSDTLNERNFTTLSVANSCALDVPVKPCYTSQESDSSSESE